MQNISLTNEIIEILQARKLTSKSTWVLPSDSSKKLTLRTATWTME
ncbi:hypothetical protein [Orientia tsutsugamushi]|nr:hypothetical protein [Orientia tsutsugamushi]